jgi:hypothetical protein
MLWHRLKNLSEGDVEAIALTLMIVIVLGGLLGVIFIHMKHDTAESWTAWATVSVALIAIVALWLQRRDAKILLAVQLATQLNADYDSRRVRRWWRRGRSAATPPNNHLPRFAYVANFYDSSVSIYTANAETGQLRHNGYVAAGASPLSVTVDPSGKFAYVANSGSSNVSAYTINATTGRTVPFGSPYRPVPIQRPHQRADAVADERWTA